MEFPFKPNVSTQLEVIIFSTIPEYMRLKFQLPIIKSGRVLDFQALHPQFPML